MKKLLAMLLAIALLCGFAALAEDGAEGLKINSFIDEGDYVIQIPVENGDLGWYADDMAQDDSVVRLVSADVLEDTFVARYAPVGDGDVTVGVRHYYTGFACDRYMTWDLRVADGAVQEVTGGSDTANPPEEDQDPYLSGAWLEAETQFTEMTVAKGAERGWDVEIVSPLSHGAYVFKTTVYYDCERGGFVYDKGKFWDLPADYEEGMSLGEAKIAGSTGIFTFAGDDQNLALEWYDDEHPETSVLFARAGAGEPVTGQSFEGEWVTITDDGDVLAYVFNDGEKYVVNMIFSTEDYTREFEIDYICDYDEELACLVSEKGAVMREIFRDEDYEVTAEEEVYDDGEAVFSLDAAGMMLWNDRSAAAAEALKFERPIGWMDPDYIGPGHHFVGEWDEERVSIVIEERMEDYLVTVSGSNGASSGTMWLYLCLYDEETDSLVSVEDEAYKIDYTIDEDGEYSEECVYSDGAAAFTLDGEGRLIWDDKVDNAGEDRAFVRVPMEEEDFGDD